MSASIVYQDFNAKQTSRNDDPFNLRGAFKGLDMSKHQNNLDKYIANIADDYATENRDGMSLDLSMLPKQETDKLLRLYIESIDRETENAHLGLDESANSSFYCALQAMLADNNEDTKQQLADTINANMLEYYKEVLNRLLEDGCNKLFAYRMEGEGFYLARDEQEGSYYWSAR